MKPYIVQLEIDDRKSIVYCKDGTIYKGRCIGDCIVTMMTVKMKTVFVIKLMTDMKFF